MISTIPLNSNQFIEYQIDSLVDQLEKKLDKDVLTFVGPLLYGIDDIIRDGIESRSKRRDGLAVILETQGGYIEPVRRIVEVFRHNYQGVEFIVPSHAMSAGTVLVMSGDAIHMDYYSVLGPIDPQVEGKDGNLLPALGYLVKYDTLLAKANAGDASSAEMALLTTFDQAELYKYEQDRELSITLLKEWLVRYKFKDWQVTQTRQLPVTPSMKSRRATEIARILNKTDRWHTHGCGITMEVLRRDLRLLIDDFGEDTELEDAIRSHYRLSVDYMRRRGWNGFLHRMERIVPI